MLSYQHQYHAGNHADVLKHWLLIECIEHLKKKDKPFDYIDTHAGAGRYQLNSSEAQKTGEHKDGIAKLKGLSWPELDTYLSLVQEDLSKQQYPGSPEIVNRMLRRGDHSWLHEMHPKTYNELERNCARKRQTIVRHEDGYSGMTGLLPVASHRALVLIDPSYEVKSEYDMAFEAINKAWKKMSQTTFLLWFPVVDRPRIDRLEKRFKKSAIKNIQVFEMGVSDDEGKGMTASGLIVVNPPWTLAERFKLLVPKLSSLLADDDKSRARHEIITPE